MSALARFLADSALITRPSLPVLRSSRVRLARNLADAFFPDRLAPRERDALKTRMIDALTRLPEFEGATVFDMRGLEPTEARLLAERRFISAELVGREGAAVVVSADRKCSVMLNEEDHLRIQATDANPDLARLARAAEALSDAIGAALPYARSPRYGFLTACPTNLGTGMRVSVMAHLPGLVMDGQMEKVVRALDMCGMTVRGWLGEGSDATGSFFQISNRRTLDRPADAIVADLVEWSRSLVEQERNARRRVVRKNRTGVADQIGRVYGESRFGVTLSQGEAVSALSLLRLACDLGVFPEYARARIDDLLEEALDAHVAFRQKIPEDREHAAALDRARATLFRETFSTIPPPDFSKL